MIFALMMGRKDSKGFPDKNIKKILGRRIFEYPLIACKSSKNVDKIFTQSGQLLQKVKGEKITKSGISKGKDIK